MSPRVGFPIVFVMSQHTLDSVSAMCAIGDTVWVSGLISPSEMLLKLEHEYKHL